MIRAQFDDSYTKLVNAIAWEIHQRFEVDPNEFDIPDDADDDQVCALNDAKDHAITAAIDAKIGDHYHVTSLHAALETLHRSHNPNALFDHAKGALADVDSVDDAVCRMARAAMHADIAEQVGKLVGS